jgi:hypothetical protein
VISIIICFTSGVYQITNPNCKNGHLMIRSTLCAIVALSAFPAAAQHAHNSSGGPVETGQSAFAAIAEIVQILSDDPDTDWSKVNIQALRDHLVDMELVTTEANVRAQSEGRIVEFNVTGEGDVADAIGRMVLAHSPMLEMASEWTVTAEPFTNGAAMRIEVDTDPEFARVLGLGFFGIMTIGAHHQAHHLQMAMGTDPHH